MKLEAHSQQPNNTVERTVQSLRTLFRCYLLPFTLAVRPRHEVQQIIRSISSQKMFKIGDQVRVLQVPPSVLEQMPFETTVIFKCCVGQILRIDGFDTYGHLELNMMDNGQQAPDYCHHTIWIEPEYVELIDLEM